MVKDNSARVHLVWDEAFTKHDFGMGHPMNPSRLAMTARLCEELGLFADESLRIVSGGVADDDLLSLVHDGEYVEAVRAASADLAAADAAFGLGTDDDPAFAGMHETAARMVGGTVAVADAVWSGEARYGVNFCGGMHHAMPRSAAGFCIYNDAGVAIQRLLDAGAERVAYVDLDAHHGDGVERMFWDDPRVLTVSIHETGRVLFPGTGFPGDTGGPNAPGSAVNVALPPGTGDHQWLRAIHAVVPPVIQAFEPQVLFTQHGCDCHRSDPLAHLSISMDAIAESAVAMRDLAELTCGGRWVALGGGGYELVDVVPRAWAHLTSTALGRPLDLEMEVPQAWRDWVMEVYGQDTPPSMGDGASEGGRVWWRSWQTGYHPEDPVDRAIMATREAIFPSLGLDLWHD